MDKLQKKAYNKAYREANIEAITKQQKAYREANKEAIVERGKAYREANKEVLAEKHKAWREVNKEAQAAYKKAYYEVNKEAIVERDNTRYRTPRGKYRNIKHRAKRYELEFSLPFELYESQLWGKSCHYCGASIEVTGLDRKDNNKGYTIDNVVPCCWTCNTKKGTQPYKQYLSEIRNQKRDDNT